MIPAKDCDFSLRCGIMCEKRGDIMLKYEQLSEEMSLKIGNDRKNGSMPALGFDEASVIRRSNECDRANSSSLIV